MKRKSTRKPWDEKPQEAVTVEEKPSQSLGKKPDKTVDINRRPRWEKSRRHGRITPKMRSAVIWPRRPQTKLHLPCFTQFDVLAPPDLAKGAVSISERWQDGVGGYSPSQFALNMAYIMGAKEVALMGFDLNDNSHFYTDNPRYGNKFIEFAKKITDPNASFPKAAGRIKAWDAYAKEYKIKGLKIWNCSKNSAIRSFEYKPLADLLNRPGKKIYPNWLESLDTWIATATKFGRDEESPKVKDDRHYFAFLNE